MQIRSITGLKKIATFTLLSLTLLASAQAGMKQTDNSNIFQKISASAKNNYNALTSEKEGFLIIGANDPFEASRELAANTPTKLNHTNTQIVALDISNSSLITLQEFLRENHPQTELEIATFKNTAGNLPEFAGKSTKFLLETITSIENLNNQGISVRGTHRTPDKSSLADKVEYLGTLKGRVTVFTTDSQTQTNDPQKGLDAALKSQGFNANSIDLDYITHINIDTQKLTRSFSKATGPGTADVSLSQNKKTTHEFNNEIISFIETNFKDAKSINSVTTKTPKVTKLPSIKNTGQQNLNTVSSQIFLDHNNELNNPSENLPAASIQDKNGIMHLIYAEHGVLAQTENIPNYIQINLKTGISLAQYPDGTQQISNHFKNILDAEGLKVENIQGTPTLIPNLNPNKTLETNLKDQTTNSKVKDITNKFLNSTKDIFKRDTEDKKLTKLFDICAKPSSELCQDEIALKDKLQLEVGQYRNTKTGGLNQLGMDKFKNKSNFKTLADASGKDKSFQIQTARTTVTTKLKQIQQTASLSQ
jgi:hypothetical protein